ncbi:MAG TPA: hypothetical protein VGE02_13180 [Gemmatimonadales bacterium]
MRTRRRTAALLLPCATLLASTLSTTGCHRYTQLAPDDLAPGRVVRAELGDQGTAELARWIGPRSEYVGGRLDSVSDTAFTMSVTQVVRRNGVTEPWRGEQILVPRSYVSSVSERRFDRTRTILLGAGIVAAFLTVDAALGDDGILFRGRGGTGPKGRQ